MPKLTYPATRTVEHTDDYHGTLVPDPYRWLEDTDSPETLDWVTRQNQVTFGYLEQIPVRERLRRRISELWDFPKAGTIYRKGKRYFQFRNTGLQNQDVLFVMDHPKDAGRVLLDPNTLSDDGTAALNTWAVSKDGDWLAYAVSRSGSDWQVWRIRRVASGEDLPETLEWSKFSGAAWLPDGSGFFYGRYPAPEEGEAYQQANYNQKLYFHRLDTPQSADTLAYERPDQPEWGFGAAVTDDGEYLVLSVWQGTDERNRVFYRALAGGEMAELIPDLEATYEFIGNDGPVFYFRTTLDAPLGRVIAIDTASPAKAHWQTLIPESGHLLEWVFLVHDEFICIHQQDAHHVLARFDLTGQPLGNIPLLALGSFLTLGGRREDDDLFFTFNSFIDPVTVYRFDFTTATLEAVFTPPINFDFSQYETRQVFVPSKDGTVKVPMFITHKKGLAYDGQNPTLLYGYGGFDISYLPAFVVHRMAWLEMGGVFAVANLRGGGEYGLKWHDAGRLHNKQNVFDDFISCAEWLIAERVTSTPKLAIEGRSNGGLLVGACMTQRPDLFGACLPIVGVMDMLRFHKFTIGWAWVSDYGSSEDPDYFKTLHAYSPYHNLKPGTAYPPTLILTGDHDDRVVPGHSFKFAARLQASQSADAPTLIRIQTKSGHGMGKPTAILIEEWADIYSFLVESLGVEI